MHVTLFFVRADDNPENEWVLLEVVDESDTAYNARVDAGKHGDRSDVLRWELEDRYEKSPEMFRVVNIKED